MLVVMGRFQRPDASTRAMTRSAISRCSSVCGKMAERYCVPMSLPCRLGVVGSCSRKNHRSSSSSKVSTDGSRSEEHTSELQSRQYLVCRLLLEKKKKYIAY